VPEVLARAALAVGDRDVALAWLEKGMNMHSDYSPFVRYDPDLKPLLRDPRYQRMLDRMGLPH
jgi:hypothetical protein